MAYNIKIETLADLYLNEVIDQIELSHSPEKAKEKSMELLNVIYSLNQNPKRGSTVKELKHLGMGHLFIIYPITKRNKIKVIYFIEDSTQTIHITDFFPCQMNPSSITRRR